MKTTHYVAREPDAQGHIHYPDAEHAVCWDAALARTDGAAPNALLHTRLSIIDPRPVADQPMGNDAGDVWIAYNGEVYDWADAARELEAAGYVFRTRSDTEFMELARKVVDRDRLLLDRLARQ